MHVWYRYLLIKFFGADNERRIQPPGLLLAEGGGLECDVLRKPRNTFAPIYLILVENMSKLLRDLIRMNIR